MLPLIVSLPFLSALLFLVLPRDSMPKATPRVLAVATAALTFCLLAFHVGSAGEAGPAPFFRSWMPTVGLNLSLWLDGPAVFWGLLVLGLGTLIFLYAAFYIEPHDSPWRFFGMMTFFMGSMLGVVLSRNLLLMLVFWEMTSISSFILIGHWHQKASARAGALRALIVTGAGGLCLMGGIGVLSWQLVEAGIPLAQALEWDVLWQHRELIADGSTLSVVGMSLMLLGAFTKSAQFPFHFWLPGAMEAPTPVSAFLHAATMVKAGIYLLGRMYPIYWDQELWLVILGFTGTITMLIGGVMAITSTDLKQLLAHSTVSQLGLLTAYYGFGYGLVESEHKLPLDLMMVASHAFFKGALFMLVGVLDHGLHTRDWTRMGGLLRAMPVTAALVIVGAWSMAGLPLTMGFLAKEMFLHQGLHLEGSNPLVNKALLGLAIFSSIFTMAYCLRLTISPFFGKPRDESIHPHEGGPGLLFSPGLLIVLCLGGAWAPFAEGWIAPLVNQQYYGITSGFGLAMFHWDVLLAIAAFIAVAGAAVFLAGTRIDGVYTRMGRPEFFASSYAAIFDKAVPALGYWLVGVMQSVSLQRNVTVTLGVSFAAILAAAWHGGYRLAAVEPWVWEATPGAILVVMTAVCAWVAATHRTLLVRVLALAPVGLFVALFFLAFAAPDLALTQILVEIVMLIVLLMLLYRFPQNLAPEPRRGAGHAVRVAVALAGGLVMAGVTYHAMTGGFRSEPTLAGDPTLSEYYLANTKYPVGGGDIEAATAAGYPGGEVLRSGGGYNTVNVILVDFRGFDTFGEITVLGIAALGALMLLGLGRQALPAGVPPAGSWKATAIAGVDVLTRQGDTLPEPIVPMATHPSPSLILTEMGRLAPVFMVMLAVLLFFAGHNAPGGGFIAGLMTSVAIAILYMSFPRRAVAVFRVCDYAKFLPIGLTFAMVTGLAAMLLGFPFLTSGYVYVSLPILGKVELASAALFDLGVFSVVVGATLSIIERLGRE